MTTTITADTTANDYLINLQKRIDDLTNLIAGECNPAMDELIIDALADELTSLTTQRNQLEWKVCKRDGRTQNYVYVDRDQLTAALGETGVRVLEATFTQMWSTDMTKPWTNDITFSVNDYEWLRLTKTLSDAAVPWNSPSKPMYSLQPFNEVKRDAIIERCKTRVVIGDGMQCPHCYAFETYKPENGKLDEIERWAFMIKAFRVDDKSHCLNCDKWF